MANSRGTTNPPISRTRVPLSKAITAAVLRPPLSVASTAQPPATETYVIHIPGAVLTAAVVTHQRSSKQGRSSCSLAPSAPLGTTKASPAIQNTLATQGILLLNIIGIGIGINFEDIYIKSNANVNTNSTSYYNTNLGNTSSD